MRILVALVTFLSFHQIVLADVAFTVTGKKETVTAWGGVTYHQLVTTENEILILTKDSAEQFSDCANGTYQIVNSSAIPNNTYLILGMDCQD